MFRRRALAVGTLVALSCLASAPISQADVVPGGGGSVQCGRTQCTVEVGRPGVGGASHNPGTSPGRQTSNQTPRPTPIRNVDDFRQFFTATGGCQAGNANNCASTALGLANCFIGGPVQAAACASLPVDPVTNQPVIDPAQVAAMAVSGLAIAPPDIQMVPKLKPGDFGFIGLPVWLWTPEAQWAPISSTASLGGISVTAVAQLDSIDYDMGDGTVVRCTSPGEPYQESYGDRDSPTCGHRYEKTSVHEPNMAYTVTATANYAVTWSGAATGSTTLTDDSSTQLAMGERQVLITG